MANFVLTSLDDAFPSEGVDVTGDDSIEGLGGNDVIRSGIGNDTVLGGTGDDFVYADSGQTADHKVYDGGDGNDTLFGSEGSDTLIGGAGDDSINSFGGVDLIQAGLGDDIVSALDLPGSVSDGGEGYDRLYLSAPFRAIRADFSGPVWTALVNGKTGGVFTGFEQVFLTTGGWDDTLIGGAEVDEFFSGKGRDYMDGGAGNDRLSAYGAQVTLLGGAGDDLIEAGMRLGDQTAALALDGGSGSDQLVLALRGTSRGLLTVALDHGDLSFLMDGVLVGTATNFESLLLGTAGRTGRFLITSGSGDDDLQLGAGVARVNAGAGDDVVSKTYGTMVLNGGNGQDRLDIDLSGNLAADCMIFDARGAVGTVSLAAGPATSGTFRNFETYGIHGTAGNDVFHGGAGDDFIHGAQGSDTFEGGLGADYFIIYSRGRTGLESSLVLYGDVAESRAGAGDSLEGFGRYSTPDRIDLHAIDAVAATLEDDAFLFVGQAEFTGEGQIRVVQVGQNAVIEVNTLGSTEAEMEITLLNTDATLVGGNAFLL